MPEGPEVEVPDDVDDESYLLGVEHTARRIAGGAAALADGVAGDLQETEEADDSCPDCEIQLEETFGGLRCPSCGYEPDREDTTS